MAAYLRWTSILLALAAGVFGASASLAAADAADRSATAPHDARLHEARSMRRADPRAIVDGWFAQPRRWVMPSGSAGDAPWRMTTSAPTADWTAPDFAEEATWPIVRTGVAGGDPMPGDHAATPWPDGASELWLRTSFRIGARDVAAAMFWGRVDDTMEVYVNGVLALDERGWSHGYRYYGLKAQARAALRTDAPNVLAVHVRDTGGARYFDLGVAVQGAFASMPSAGFERTPSLAAYGEAVRTYMLEHGLGAGVLAVMKHDQIVVRRAFGWHDKRFARPLQADAVMRLASNDKVITTGAIARMIDTGFVDPATGEALTWDTPVFALLRAHGLEPLPGFAADPRSDAITIRHLHEHRAGLQELPAIDRFYADLGVAPGSATTAADNVRWAYSMPLAFDPGSQSVYSSIGYSLLRHVVHVLSGDLVAWLRSAVFEPAGTTDVFLAHERLRDRERSEPWYATLEAPYDRWIYLENYTALATTAEALARYLRRHSMGNGALLIDPVTGEWSPGPEGNGGGRFYGVMAGTWSVSEQRRWDEVNIVVIFNQDGNHDELADQLSVITDQMPADGWGL